MSRSLDAEVTRTGVESSTNRWRKARIWDVPTRVFHWLVVLAVVVAWLTGGEEGMPFLLHALAGYALVATLIFRFIWGFAGGAYARFGSFLTSWPPVVDYGKQLIRGKPPSCVGHNPLGGWMVILLLVALATMVVSGLFAQGDEGLGGPWAQQAIGLSAKDWYELHEAAFNVLLVLAVIHIAGVITDQVLTGDNLVKAMFTGEKRIPVSEVLREGIEVGAGRALVIVILSLVLTGFVARWQLPTINGAETYGHKAQEQEHQD